MTKTKKTKRVKATNSEKMVPFKNCYESMNYLMESVVLGNRGCMAVISQEVHNWEDDSEIKALVKFVSSLMAMGEDLREKFFDENYKDEAVRIAYNLANTCCKILDTEHYGSYSEKVC